MTEYSLKDEIEYDTPKVEMDSIRKSFMCPKCNVPLEAGIFLEDGYATTDPNTLWICGRNFGKAPHISIEYCWKCPSCGFSTIIELD